MNKFFCVFLILPFFILSSCSKDFVISENNISLSYKTEDRSINLWWKNIKGFVNLNWYLDWTEVNNIYVNDNYIEIIDVSKFKKLWRLDVSNNNIRFPSDIKLPSQIRHLDLSNNKLSNLWYILDLKKLKTLNVSNNNLEDNDFDFKNLDNIKYINAEWNNLSKDMFYKIDEINSFYLKYNEKPF